MLHTSHTTHHTFCTDTLHTTHTTHHTHSTHLTHCPDTHYTPHHTLYNQTHHVHITHTSHTCYRQHSPQPCTSDTPTPSTVCMECLMCTCGVCMTVVLPVKGDCKWGAAQAGGLSCVLGRGWGLLFLGRQEPPNCTGALHRQAGGVSHLGPR